MNPVSPVLVQTAFLVFCRIGGCLVVIPGFSSPRVTMRARLFIAIAVSLALTPLLQAGVMPLVEKASQTTFLGLILSEGAKGLMIGLLARIFFAALETMTTSISYAIGLSSAFAAPDDEEQTPTIVAMVALVTTMLIFSTDLHWEVFRGLAASYDVLPVQTSFDPRMGLTQIVDQTSRTFLFTLRIASPFFVFSIIMNFAIGLINKLVPQIPVSFVSTPFLIAGGLIIFYFAATPAIDLFMTAFATFMRRGS